MLYQSGRYDPDRLSSEYRHYRVQHLANFGSDGLQYLSHGSFFHLLVHLPMRSRLQDENTYHVLVKFSLDVFLPVFDLCFAIDCSSHVRLIYNSTQ